MKYSHIASGSIEWNNHFGELFCEVRCVSTSITHYIYTREMETNTHT